MVGKGWLGGDVSSAHRSGQDALHDVAVDIGQAEIATRMAIGESFVIEAQQVQHGGVQIMNVDAIFDSPISKFIGVPVGEPAANTTSRQPDRETMMVMISPRGVATTDRDFYRGRPAKFSSTNYQGFFQQAALSQIRQQAGNRSVGFLPQPPMLARNVAVRIPRLDITMITLHHAHAPFDQTPGDQQLTTMHRVRSI